MKASVLQDKLLSALKPMGACVDKKPALPILGCVKLETEDAQLKLTTTDLEVSMTTAIGAKVDVEGAALVPYRQLFDLIKAWPKGERVDIRAELGQVTFSNFDKSNVVVLDGFSPDDYPAHVDELWGDCTFSALVECQSFKRLIEGTTYAVAKEDNRPILKAVNMLFEHQKDTDWGNLSLAAADGYRIATGHVEAIGDNPVEMNVPVKALNLLARVIGKKERDVVTITASNERAMFTYNRTSVIVSLMTGKFPDWQSIVPRYTSGTYNIVVKAADLLQRLELAKSKLDMKQSAVRLEVNGAFALTVKDFRAEVPASIEGEVSVPVNNTYLADILKHSGETVTFYGMGAANPIVADDGFTTAVVMPMSDSR